MSECCTTPTRRDETRRASSRSAAPRRAAEGRAEERRGPCSIAMYLPRPFAFTSYSVKHYRTHPPPSSYNSLADPSTDPRRYATCELALSLSLTRSSHHGQLDFDPSPRSSSAQDDPGRTTTRRLQQLSGAAGPRATGGKHAGGIGRRGRGRGRGRRGRKMALLKRKDRVNRFRQVTSQSSTIPNFTSEERNAGAPLGPLNTPRGAEIIPSEPATTIMRAKGHFFFPLSLSSLSPPLSSPLLPSPCSCLAVDRGERARAVES